MKFKLSVKLDELGLSLSDISTDVARRMQAAVVALSRMVYNKAVELANQRLKGTRQDYIKALQLVEGTEGVYEVTLDPSANWIEDDMPPHPMLPQLAQGPKSKVSKEGHRYVTIPLRQRGDAPVKVASAHGDYVSDLKRFVKSREKDFKTVREGISAKTGRRTTVERLTGGDIPQHMKGLTRVREYKAGATRPTSSAYLTFRTASEKQDPQKHWFHPGKPGANIFRDLDNWTDQQMNTIISQFFE